MLGRPITQEDVTKAFEKAWGVALEDSEEFLFLHQEYISLKQDFEKQNESIEQERETSVAPLVA